MNRFIVIEEKVIGQDFGSVWVKHVEMLKFANKVICQYPPLPGQTVHALPVLNHDRTDHHTKPVEYWCIATEV